MNRARQLVQHLRSDGVWGTWKLFVDGYLTVNSFLVFFLDLTKPPVPVDTPDGVVCRTATLAELNALRAGRTDLPMEFFGDTVFGFQELLLAFDSGQLAGITWLIRPGDASRFLDLKPGDVELNYITVLPAFRGRRLAQSLTSALADHARKASHSRLFVVVHVQNIPQYKPMIDLGFRPVETLTHFGMRRPKATLRFVK